MISPVAADRVRKVVGYGLATLLTVLLFRVLGRLAAGRQGLDVEVVALVVLATLAILWVRAAKRVRAATTPRPGTPASPPATAEDGPGSEPAGQ